MLLKREGGFLRRGGRVLKKLGLVRGTGGGPLPQASKKGGGVLKNPVLVLGSSTPSRRPPL